MLALALLPYYQDPVHEHTQSLIKAQAPQLSMKGIADIAQCRNILVMNGMKHSEAEVFVFVDGDIEFRTEDWLGIVEACRETKGIIGGSYSTKRMPGTLIGAPVDMTQTITTYAQGKLYPATMIGLGFTAMHREALDKLCTAHPQLWMSARNVQACPLFMPLIRDGRVWGEDFSFCFRALDLGIPIHIDTRPKLKHWGQYGFRLEELGVSSPERPSIEISLKQGESP